jgi:hypothetical protein
MFSCAKCEVGLCVYPCFEDYLKKLNLLILHSLTDVPAGLKMQRVCACYVSNKNVLCILISEKNNKQFLWANLCFVCMSTVFI